MKKEIMEPNDIDKLLRDKILESNEVHKKEMDSAKPFVWSAVYNEIGRKKSLSWYHLAAAIILLLITFSLVLYSVQRNHKEELIVLSGKIDQLEDNYLQQLKLLENKNAQLSSLAVKLDEVEENVVDFQQTTKVVERLVYRTDTVYIKQVEYINKTTEPTFVESQVQSPDTQISIVKSEGQKENQIDDIIYPSVSGQQMKEKPESIKFKFGAFTARSN